MAASEFARAARTLTRVDFVARYGGLFLVMPSSQGDGEIGFQTRVGRKPSGPAEPLASEVSSSDDSDEDGGLEVLPVKKAPGNPYPDRISVGRARNCDVVLRDASVSKLHAHFMVRGDGFDLTDLGSHNGTKVNAKTLAPHAATAVAPGDTLYFGVVRVDLMDSGRLYDVYQRYGGF